MLQTITAHDGVAAACAATVKAALAAALPTAAEYLALYEQYAPLVKLDVPKWIEEYEAGEKTIAEMRADVTKELAKAAAAEEAIPLTMSLGLFTVSCAAVRKFVVDHHRNLALEIPKVLARRVRAKGDELKEQFQEIARALHKKPTNVEEVAELEEYASRDSNRGRERRPASLSRASPPHHSPSAGTWPASTCPWPSCSRA